MVQPKGRLFKATKDQKLLDRLKAIPKLKQESVYVKPVKEDIATEGNLSEKRLFNLIKLFTNDPIKWNPDILAKVYKIPSGHSHCVTQYVSPLAYFTDHTCDEPKNIIGAMPTVIDVSLLKSDTTSSRFNWIKDLKFIDISQTEDNPPS